MGESNLDDGNGYDRIAAVANDPLPCRGRTRGVKRPELDGHCTQNARHRTTANALQQTSAERRVGATSPPR